MVSELLVCAFYVVPLLLLLLFVLIQCAPPDKQAQSSSIKFNQKAHTNDNGKITHQMLAKKTASKQSNDVSLKNVQVITSGKDNESKLRLNQKQQTKVTTSATKQGGFNFTNAYKTTLNSLFGTPLKDTSKNVTKNVKTNLPLKQKSTALKSSLKATPTKEPQSLNIKIASFTNTNGKLLKIAKDAVVDKSNAPLTKVDIAMATKSNAYNETSKEMLDALSYKTEVFEAGHSTIPDFGSPAKSKQT